MFVLLIIYRNIAKIYYYFLIFLAIAKVALDVRLGCLDKNPNPDTQKLIDAVNTFFINVPILELKIPFWRLFSTPRWMQFIKALDDITEYYFFLFFI